MTPTTYACARCVWAQPLSFVADNFTHLCRKDPPQLAPKLGGRAGFWPLVRAEDYCGQFTPKREDA